MEIEKYNELVEKFNEQCYGVRPDEFVSSILSGFSDICDNDVVLNFRYDDVTDEFDEVSLNVTLLYRGLKMVMNFYRDSEVGVVTFFNGEHIHNNSYKSDEIFDKIKRFIDKSKK